MQKDKLIELHISNLSDRYNVTEKEIEKVVDCMYDFIYTTLTGIKFEEMTLEGFRATKKNFNIPGLCKLHTIEKRFINMNKKLENED